MTVDFGAKEIGFRGLTWTPGPLLTHLQTVYMAYSTHLNPLAERPCFSQVDFGAKDVLIQIGATNATGSYGAGDAGYAAYQPISRWTEALWTDPHQL
jgi:hypothetical protein